MESDLESRIVTLLEVKPTPISLENILKLSAGNGFSDFEVRNAVLNCILTNKIKVEDGLLCSLHPTDSPIVMVKDIIKQILVLMATESKEMSNGANQILRDHLDFLKPDF